MSQPSDFQPQVDIGEWIRANSKDLYKTNKVVLRESLQNAIDAIRMCHGISDEQRRVEIKYIPDSQELIISDFGVGMTAEDQRNSFWRPYGSQKRNLSEKVRIEEGIIGRFGIGAYSAFRVARQIMVVSRSYREPTSEPSGTMARLDQPLDSYLSTDVPRVTFAIVPKEIWAQYWNPRCRHGTLVILTLVDPLDEDDTRKWLENAAVYLTELIVFQGVPLNSTPLPLPNLSGQNFRTVTIDVEEICSSYSLSKLHANVLCKKSGESMCEIVSASISTSGGVIEVPCGGVMRLPKGRDRGVLKLLKHRFIFSEIADTESWTSSAREVEDEQTSFKFDGLLNLPFLEPDSSREGFSEEGLSNMSALLVAVSAAIAENIGILGGETLRRCDPIFSYLFHERHLRDGILRSYPFRKFPSKEVIKLKDLNLLWAQGDLNIRFLTEEADKKTEELAKSLATLEDYCVLIMDGPTYWRGLVLTKVLEENFGARNVAGATSFLSVLTETELGSWRDYRASFTIALDRIVGAGHQLQLARIEPPSVIAVVQEGSSIIYLNFLNSEVARLPDANLYGVELDAKVRSWLFGKVEAARIEDALMREGKLLIVQKVISLHVIDSAKANYIPQPDHQFLRIKDGEVSYFALRVSVLCQEDLLSVITKEGVLKPGYEAQLTWIGPSFHFTIRNHDHSIPVLVFSFNTGVVLKNKDQKMSVEGRMPLNLLIKAFAGPHLTGNVNFFALPDWIGEHLETERAKKGSLMISMWSDAYYLKEGPA